MKSSSIQPASRSYAVMWVLSILFAITVLTLAIANDVPSMPHDESTDPITYMQDAQDLLHYDSPTHPPMYSMAIALFRLPIRNVFLAAKLVSLVAGVLTLWLIFLIGRDHFGRADIGLLAALLTALSPLMISASYSPSSDMLGSMLFLAAAYALARCRIESYRWLILAGVLAGLAYLTRYVFVATVPAAIVFLGIFLPGTFRQRLRSIGLWLAAFFVTIAPWTIICLVRHGNLHNLNHVNVLVAIVGNTVPEVKIWKQAQEVPGLLNILLSYPKEIAANFGRNLLHFPADSILHETLLAGLAFLVGIIHLLRRPTIGRAALILNFGALVLLNAMVFFKPRFFVPFLPLTILFGAYVLMTGVAKNLSSWWPREAGFRSIAQRIPLRVTVVSVTTLVAVAYATYAVPRDFTERNRDDMKRAGEFIAAHTPEGYPVVTTSKLLTWYAHRPYRNVLLTIGDGNPDSLAARVNAAGGKVFVYSQRSMDWDFPHLSFLADPDDPRVPATWRLLYLDTSEVPLVVYLTDSDSTSNIK